MTIQLTPSQEERLLNLAGLTARAPEDLVQEALGQFLAYEEDMAAAVQRGGEDIAAGRLVEHSEVVARIERLLDGRRLQ
jgi:predicted transcriptional regulator